MANNLTVTYKGSTIHTASASGSATLETGGTWCEDDIGLNYEFDESIATLAVTVTNGTATSVVATKGSDSVSLTDSGGAWIAELPSFGEWTVTITDGTHTNTATVSATQAGLYTISIYMPDVPSAYTQLEYLESSGTQYIDTGLNASGTLGVELEFLFPDPTAIQQNGAIKRYTDGGTKYMRHHLQCANDNFYYGYRISGVLSAIASADSNKHSVIIRPDISKFEFDGATISDMVSLTFDIGANYWLFGRNSPSMELSYATIRIYTCAMYSNGTPSRNYYPVRRNSDSVLGMYDTVNNVFYTNAGSGSFTAGPAI